MTAKSDLSVGIFSFFHSLIFDCARLTLFNCYRYDKPKDLQLKKNIFQITKISMFLRNKCKTETEISI